MLKTILKQLDLKAATKYRAFHKLAAPSTTFLRPFHNVIQDHEPRQVIFLRHGQSTWNQQVFLLIICY